MGIAEHYPIRKRGQKRQLNPNRSGIAWLEEKYEDVTEILSDKYDLGASYGDRGLFDVISSVGGIAKRRLGEVVRPMFEPFDLDASSSMMQRTVNPCPNCDDWSRTMKCDSHTEAKAHEYSRAGQSRPTTYVNPFDGNRAIAEAYGIPCAPPAAALARYQSGTMRYDAVFPRMLPSTRNLRPEGESFTINVTGETIQVTMDDAAHTFTMEATRNDGT